MMLSRLELEPRSRHVVQAVRDPHALHILVMRAFPAGEQPRTNFGVLHRLDSDGRGKLVLYVQSRETPDWSLLPEGTFPASTAESDRAPRSLAEDLAALRPNALFAFRLRANPARKVDTKSGADGKKRNGRRVPLRDPDARLGWFRRKAESAGFELIDGPLGEPELRVIEEGPLTGSRKSGEAVSRVTVEAARFDGVARVKDPEKLREAIAAGIGPARAYGCGLLSFRVVG